MAKNKAPSILQVNNDIKKGILLPLYYFFGDDSLNINSAVESIAGAIEPHISSDFDKEKFYGESSSLNDVLDIVKAFPLASEKKLIIFKQFEKVKDKKPLKEYALSPADFATLILIHNGTITNLNSEPYKTLLANNFIFEAKELKGRALIDWLKSYLESEGKKISEDNAQVLVDIVGENRNLLEAQLEKLLIFTKPGTEITLESIRELSSGTKQFNIFDLQNALGIRDKEKSVKVAYNLLENGFEPVFIVTMLTRYFTALAKVKDMKGKGIPDNAAAKIINIHPYYYSGYVKARNLYSDSKLVNVFRALLRADVSIKTTSVDNKTVITILLSEILQ